MTATGPRPRTGRSAALVLAAGGSSRLGRPKQLLRSGGRNLLEMVLGEVCASGVDEVVVVLGADVEQILANSDLGRSRVVVNPDYSSGMASSLKTGIRSLGRRLGRAVVVLGDQPGVTAGMIDRLIALQVESGRPAAALSTSGVLQPPVVLGRELWPRLRRLEGDTGLRSVLRAEPQLVAALPWELESGQPVDIDTMADWVLFRSTVEGN